MAKYYIAYGSNLNVQQMRRRCPDAYIAGVGYMKGWKLVFRGNSRLCGVLNIEQAKGEEIPIGIWRISEKDEKNLDIYEGYPHLYRKAFFPVRIEGEDTVAMAYIMTDGHEVAPPSESYFDTVKQGYKDFMFDNACLTMARKSALMV